mgnify:CR=1 FL=1
MPSIAHYVIVDPEARRKYFEKTVAEHYEHGKAIQRSTTFGVDDYVYDALRAGASGFMLKDAPPEEIAAAVRIVASGDALLAPAITRAAILATGCPMALATKGTVRLARGLTSRTKIRGASDSEVMAIAAGEIFAGVNALAALPKTSPWVPVVTTEPVAFTRVRPGETLRAHVEMAEALLRPL